MLTFISRLDNKGPGAHKVRENHKFYNTDKEKELLTPNFGYYWEESQKLQKLRITVDLFVCAHAVLDLPFISPVAYETGGDIQYYKNFSERLDGEKMMYDVFRVLTRNVAYDTSCRMRVSTGYSVKSYYGQFVRRE